MKNSKKKTISDPFTLNKPQKERQEHKKYEGPGFGEDLKDKDYKASNDKQEDDYNSNKLGNGSKAANETTRKKNKR